MKYRRNGLPRWHRGLATRDGVKQAQIKLGLPADSFPTAELIGRLGGR